MDPVQQANQNLRNVLLKGRILLNGMALTGEEISNLLINVNVLFEGASKLQAAEKLLADKKAAKDTPKKKEK